MAGLTAATHGHKHQRSVAVQAAHATSVAVVVYVHASSCSTVFSMPRFALLIPPLYCATVDTGTGTSTTMLAAPCCNCCTLVGVGCQPSIDRADIGDAVDDTADTG